MKYCVQCGEVCVDNAEYCPECGHPNFAPEFVQYCAVCGAACELLTKRCPECNGREFYYEEDDYEMEALLEVIEKEDDAELYLEAFHIENGILKKYDGDEERIIIPESVKKIESRAFENCDFIQEVVIPDGIYEIGSYAFKGCNALRTVRFPAVIEKNRSFEIGGGCFQNCTALKKVTLPEGMKDIRSGTFFGCEGLEEVVLPISLECIAENAFAYCGSLRSIFIPPLVSVIGVNAFHYCNNLTIYASAKKKPKDWYEKKGFLGFGIAKDIAGKPISWNSAECPVVWGAAEPQKPSAYEELDEPEELLLEEQAEIECKEKMCAPFPGFIKNRLVKEGEFVRKNQPIIILEAMKMDNDLVAPCDGIVHFIIKEYTQVTVDQLIAVIT